MTTAPAEPTTPAAPAAPAPTEPPTAVATPPGPKPTEPPPAATPPAGTNPWDDPAAARAEIQRLRQENGAERVNAKAQAAEEARAELAQTIGKALGIVKDEAIDPAKLTESLTASQAEASRARVELAVFRNAGTTGDPAALLDSSSFLKSLDGVDPSDSAAIAAAIAKAVEANPRLGAVTDPRSPAPNPAQGTSASGPTTPAQMSKADVERLAAEGKHAEIEKARIEGRLNDLLGIK